MLQYGVAVPTPNVILSRRESHYVCESEIALEISQSQERKGEWPETASLTNFLVRRIGLDCKLSRVAAGTFPNLEPSEVTEKLYRMPIA